MYTGKNNKMPSSSSPSQEPTESKETQDLNVSLMRDVALSIDGNFVSYDEDFNYQK
jgi:hypothetical protein